MIFVGKLSTSGPQSALLWLSWHKGIMSNMSELALTAERRSQLSVWLNDEPLLRAEYPKVAEYLSMALRLPGTGDDRADAAFDLRLLHYMTSAESASTNPYWEIVAPSVFDYKGRRVVNGGSPQGSGQLAFAQMILQATYAYAIPSPETVDWVCRFCDGRAVVEMGAGRGYWAHQLSRAGLVIDAYELEPPDTTENASFPQAAGQQDVWYPIGSLGDLRPGERPDAVLFLCWPPGWQNTMASDALTAFEQVGGDRLIYIGEPRGGKTGDDAFFDALSDRWAVASTDDHFVSWWNLADRAQGWVRQR